MLQQKKGMLHTRKFLYIREVRIHSDAGVSVMFSVPQGSSNSAAPHFKNSIKVRFVNTMLVASQSSIPVQRNVHTTEDKMANVDYEPKLTGQSFSLDMSTAAEGVKLWAEMIYVPMTKVKGTHVEEVIGCPSQTRSPLCNSKPFTASRMLLSLTRRAFSYTTTRTFTTEHTRASSAFADGCSLWDPAVSSTPDDITSQQRAVLDSALRVDHAGEIAANWIYKGQMSVLVGIPLLGI